MEKKTKQDLLRGFHDDDEDIPVAQRRTAQQKINMLELMLGQVANYCPIISRNTIVRASTCVDSTWNAIHLHFGFQVTGVHPIDFNDIYLEANERKEDLYQRLTAFIEDSLLRSGGELSHHGKTITEDEEMSPTLENLVVLTWLRLIHPSLHKRVKQRYGTELRSRTLASIKTEILQAMDSLLDEINASDDAQVMRAQTTNTRSKQPLQNTFRTRPFTKFQDRHNARVKNYPICKQAGGSDYAHFLSRCNCLPESDRKYLEKARQIVNILETDYDNDDISDEEQGNDHPHSDPSQSARLVQVRQSPYIDTFYRHVPAI